jgi:hypothetical protein
MRRTLPLLLLLLPLVSQGEADKYPQGYFRSPLGIDLYMAGNFAEMRSNHFHSGLDLKTNAREGYRVYASADGWVSRVVVSPFGFGHALYVAHPNGYTTVYAHLSQFSEPVASYVKALQYRQKSFSVDAYPSKGEFSVQQGGVIALSGNSGGSGGPHLHFEIRDSGQNPLNPLLFGLDVKDTTPPRIYQVKVYPSEGGFAEIKLRGRAAPVRATPGEPAVLEVESRNAGYALKDVEQIRAWGRLGFGVRAHDYHEGSSSRLGAYRIRLTAGEDQLYRSEMEKFSFDETRYLNAHVDYGEYRRSRRWVQRSHLLAGNPLPFYEASNRGYLDVEPGRQYAMAYTIEDAYGNTAHLEFAVEGLDAPSAVIESADEYESLVARTRPTTFERGNITARFPAGAVYEDLKMHFGAAPAPAGAFSPAFTLHDDETPVHAYYTLSIRPEGLPSALRPQALIGIVDDKGKVGSIGGRYENGAVTARVRTFGTFVVAVDTTAPEITPLNISDGKNMGQAASIRVKIDDDFSGIDSYEGRIDGAWVLFEYDAKNDLLEYTFDERVAPGAHTLEVVVRDPVGNTGIYQARFTR